MKRIFKTITLAMASVLLLSSCGVVRKQDQFVLSTFFAVGGSADKQQYTKMLTLTKESGINLVELTFLSGQALDTALQVCEEIQLYNIAQDLTQYSGFGVDVKKSLVIMQQQDIHAVGQFRGSENKAR